MANLGLLNFLLQIKCIQDLKRIANKCTGIITYNYVFINQVLIS